MFWHICKAETFLSKNLIGDTLSPFKVTLGYFEEIKMADKMAAKMEKHWYCAVKLPLYTICLKYKKLQYSLYCWHLGILLVNYSHNQILGASRIVSVNRKWNRWYNVPSSCSWTLGGTCLQTRPLLEAKTLVSQIVGFWLLHVSHMRPAKAQKSLLAGRTYKVWTSMTDGWDKTRTCLASLDATLQ